MSVNYEDYIIRFILPSPQIMKDFVNRVVGRQLAELDHRGCELGIQFKKIRYKICPLLYRSIPLDPRHGL